MGRVIRADLEGRLNARLSALAERHDRLVPRDELMDGIMTVLAEFDWSHCPQATPEAIARLSGEIRELFESGLANRWAGDSLFLLEPNRGYEILDVLARHSYIPTYWRPVTDSPVISGEFLLDGDLIEHKVPITLHYIAEDGSREDVTFQLKYRMDDSGPRVGQTPDGRWLTYDRDSTGRLEGGYVGWWVAFHSERPRQWWEGMLNP